MESKKKIEKPKMQYKAIFDSVDDGILVLDMEGKIIENNPKIIEMYGYSHDELKELDITKLIHSDYHPAFMKALEVMQNGGIFITEGINIKKDGKEFWVQVKCNLFEYNDKMHIVSVVRDITEQKKSEVIFKESFRIMTDQLLVGIGIIQDDKIIYINQKICDTFGYSYDELINWKLKDFGRIIHPDSLEEEIEYINQILKDPNKKEIHFQSKAITKLGEIIWAENLLKKFIFNGRPAVLGIFIDITEIKKTEQKLRESEEKFRTLTEQSLMGIAILQDNRFCYVNKKIANIFGYTPKEMKNWDKLEYSKLIHPDDREMAIEQARKKQLGLHNAIIHYKFRGISKNNEIKWMEIYSNTFIYQGRNADLITIIDITDKKEAEEKYRELVETSSMALLEIDLINKKASFANPKLLEIIGYSKEELNDETVFYNVVHPNDLQKIIHLKGDQDLDFRIITKKGKIKWLSGRRLFQFNHNGEIEGLRLWLQDITEKEKLKQLKKEFIDRTSHELKTPLISIKGFTEFLLELYADKFDSDIISILKMVLKGCQRLEILINQIIESSYLASDRTKLTKEKEDLSYLINFCVDELSGFAQMRNISISLNLHKKLITKFEKEKIHIVIDNLLINAIQYTPPNGEVKIETEIRDNFFLVSIHDTGIGITKDEKKIIFNQFGKIERYGKGWDVGIEGSGLGLFISKRIIELHKGTIWVESDGRNKGSTFYFSLPII